MASSRSTSPATADRRADAGATPPPVSRRALELPRGRLGINRLVLSVALYLALTQNLTFWHQVLLGLPEGVGGRDLGLLASLAVALVALFTLVMAPLSARPLVKPVLILLLMIAAGCSYFMGAYGTVIDTSMIANLVQTDAREAGELWSPSLVGHVLLQGVLPAILVARVRLTTGGMAGEALRRGLLALLVLAVLAASVATNYKSLTLWVREHRDIRLYANPTYPLYSLANYLSLQFQADAQAPAALIPVARDAVLHPAVSGKPRVVVTVVGETARAQNFSLLGYSRPTNPQLAATAGVVAFSQMWSCGTATAVSVPCMFSRLGRADFSTTKAAAEENLLDVLQRAGVAVLWRDNNSSCKGVCARVPTEDLRRQRAPAICDADGCRDEILLTGLDDLIAQTQGDRFIVLHLLGSHGPAYYKRYPPAFRRFQPDCAQDDVQHCARAAIVNAYDNSILYTDQVLAQVIALLQRHAGAIEPTMVYLSDHGESLGENGIYLHGLPYALAPDEQKHVPMVVWAPTRDQACLQAQRERLSSHDNLFDTVLGLFAVSTRVYRPSADLLRGCEPPASRPALKTG